MPQIISPRNFPVETLKPGSPRTRLVTVPERVADALRPEHDRSRIPAHVTLGPQGVPFEGELSEEMSSALRGTLKPNEHRVIATLRRRWNFVGFSVDPGNTTKGIKAALRVLVKDVPAIAPGTTLTIPPGPPLAQFANTMGCRCELVVFGETGDGAGPVSRIRGCIWGMSEQ